MTAVLLLLCVLVSRDWFKAALMASIAYLLMANYSGFEKLAMSVIAKVRYWHMAPLMIVVLLHIAYFVFTKLSGNFAKLSVQVVALVFSALILVNVVTSVPMIIAKVQAQRAVTERQNEMVDDSVALTEMHPNIYYLLFDEYSNFPVLEKYYQYDNQDLMDLLVANHFSVSRTSHNESKATVIVTTNNLNLNYVATSAVDYEQYRVNPELFKLLKQNGYDIHYLSSLALQWHDENSTEQSASEAKTVDGLTLSDIFVQKTILYPFLTRDKSNAEREQFYEYFDFLNNSIKLKDRNTFVYVHFLAPHFPYIFDENGNGVSMANRNNTEEKQYYLGQFIYTTKYMMDSVKKIIDADPEAIIILQSDHSNRYVGLPLGQGSLTTFDEATNIFNAVYFGGKEGAEIEGLSSVNTLRTVLNDILQTDFEMLEVPRYE